MTSSAKEIHEAYRELATEEEWEEAKQLLDDYLGENKPNARLFLDRGRVNFELGRFGKAKKDFEKSLELKPGQEKVEKWLQRIEKTTSRSKSGGREYTTCPECKAKILEKNLSSHLRRVHPDYVPSSPRRRVRAGPWYRSPVGIAGIVLVLVVGGWITYNFLTRDSDAEGNFIEIVVEGSVSGVIKIELLEDEKPETVANFKKYVEDGFYTDTIFHRVIAGFMVQGGGHDLTSGALKDTDPPIQPEEGCASDPNGLCGSRGYIQNLPYTMSMARAGTDADSQFFINVNHNEHLDTTDPPFVVFGRVLAGTEVVDQIEDQSTGSGPGGQSDWPNDPIIIRQIRYTEA